MEADGVCLQYGHTYPMPGVFLIIRRLILVRY